MKMYYDDLYNYGSGLQKDDGLIKDCIQEVFISFMAKKGNSHDDFISQILFPESY